jgi:hypothetical protein
MSQRKKEGHRKKLRSWGKRERWKGLVVRIGTENCILLSVVLNGFATSSLPVRENTQIEGV